MQFGAEGPPCSEKPEHEVGLRMHALASQRLLAKAGAGPQHQGVRDVGCTGTVTLQGSRYGGLDSAPLCGLRTAVVTDVAGLAAAV